MCFQPVGRKTASIFDDSFIAYATSSNRTSFTRVIADYDSGAEIVRENTKIVRSLNENCIYVLYILENLVLYGVLREKSSCKLNGCRCIVYG